jgi:hypothetical protein
VGKTDVSAESPRPHTSDAEFRRPCGVRTRNLPAENRASCQLAPTVRDGDYRPPSYRVDLDGFEPSTPGLPNRCATCCATSPYGSGSRSAKTVNRRLPVPGPSRRGTHDRAAPGNTSKPARTGLLEYVPSTVELTQNNSTERIQGTHGRQDSNLQPSVLETGALYR